VQLAFAAILCLLALQDPTGDKPGKPVVVAIETEVGTIEVEVDATRAPLTAANFLRYVDGRFYDGGEFHRTVRPDTEVRPDVPIQVVQARIDQARAAEAFPPIRLETTRATGLKHLDGTISMARDVTPNRPGPDTATSGFFICIGDQPILDESGARSPDGLGFAAFGRVISGMETVRRIHMAPVSRSSPATPIAGAGQTLEPLIRIRRAYRK
jgi:peptidyl-prolyl cis-trans isomerase A (cyclophilin A)